MRIFLYFCIMVKTIAGGERMNVNAGDVITFERTFTREDVHLFTTVSKDEGEHHVIPDEQGRLVIQGLLTATLPTKIGGDFNVFARTMHFDFLKPVYTGDTVRCVTTIEKLEQQKEDRYWIKGVFTCTNQHDTEVLRGYFDGSIFTGK